MTTLSPPPVLQAAEQRLARIYDRAHRLRLARQIVRVLLAILGLLFLGVLLLGRIQHTLGSHLAAVAIFAGVEAVIAGGLLSGVFLAERERVNAASSVVIIATVIGACSLSLFANVFLQTAHVNTLVGFLVLIVGIVVAGLLGTIGWMVATTLFVNGFTVVAVLWLLPHFSPGVGSVNPTSVLIIEISVQWVCATLLSYNQFYIRQMIRTLSATQISYEQAQQLDDLKDQFISSVNHELRNPIMAMMNYVAILRQRNQEMAAERRATYLESLDDTGRRVIQLIGSILDIRQMTQHPEDFEAAPVPLKETLLASSRLLDPNEARMTERDLFITIPDDMTIWGNGVYLQQIFTNLLSNAIKYSAPGTAIEVRATAMTGARATSGMPVEITLRDYGLGIPADQLPLLFHRFARLPRDLMSSTSGNGLGLYLCKVLTEAMGGQIWVESSGIEGEGSAFHLVLPTTAVIPVPAEQTAPRLVLGRMPVRQARLVLAGALALLVLVGATVALTQPPAPAAPVTGYLRFMDANGGYSNTLDLHVAGLASAPEGSHYQAWLVDTTNEGIVNLGMLVPQDNDYALVPDGSPSAANLLGSGNEIEVTVERQPTTTPNGQVVFIGTFPPKAMVHVRHLLVSFPTTPNKVGLLVGVVQQMQVLSQQTQLLSGAVGNAARSQCIILSQLGVLEGKAAPALPATCRALAIPQGDGFGLLAASATTPGGYIDLASAHATLAMQQSDATASIKQHGSRVISMLTAFSGQVGALDAQLRQLNAHFAPAQVASVVAEVQALVGNPPPGPGAGPPPSGPPNGPPTSAFSAYGEGQQMSSFTLSYRH